MLRGDRNGVCLAVVPGNSEVNEKALARLTGDRKMEMVPLKEVQGADRLYSRRSDGARREARFSGVRGRDG